MSTRTGDLDPILVLQLMEDMHCSPSELDGILNKKSGLLGVSGVSSDIRDLIKLMDVGENKEAALAYEMYISRLRKTIASFAMLMHGVDVLIFTDDIGIQNPQVRRSVCEGMSWCGIDLDSGLNDMVDIKKINAIQSGYEKTVILAMPTDEELVIAREGTRLFLGGSL
jgi:acetate kinase